MCAKLGNKRAVDGFAVRPGIGGKGLNKTVGEHLFGVQFVASHVIGKREDTMAMAFVHVALRLLDRALLEFDGDNLRG